MLAGWFYSYFVLYSSTHCPTLVRFSFISILYSILCSLYFSPILFSVRYLTLAQVKATSRLEEEFQLEIWGVVEGGHDMDRLNNSVNLSSVGTFLNLYYDVESMHKMVEGWKKIANE